MTTRIYNAIHFDTDDNDNVTFFNQTEFALIGSDSYTALTYEYDGTTIDDATPADVPDPNLYDGLIGGASVSSFENDLFVIKLVWGAASDPNVTYLFNFERTGFNETGDYLVELGGDPLGATTASEFQAVVSSLISVSDVPVGEPFQANVPFDLTTLPSLLSTTENDTVQAGEFVDNFALGLGDDWFNTDSGDNTVDGGVGSDLGFYEFMMSGVRANLSDTAQGDLAGRTVIKPNGTDRMTNFENLHGSQFNDELYLSDRSGYVFDRAGNDTVVAGDGGGLFVAGSGHDMFVGGVGTDVLSYLDDTFDGNGAAFQGINVTMTTPGAGAVTDGWGFTDTFSSVEVIEGGELADTINGSAGADEIHSDDGNDVVNGLGGDDVISILGGENTLDGGADYDQLLIDLRGDENDDLSGEVISVNLATGAVGTEGDTDEISAVSGFEYVRLRGEVAGRMTGSDADERLRGDDGNDTLNGAGGDDRIDGGDGSDQLIGGIGNDRIYGGATEADLRDNVFGGAGDDFINGGYGNDELRGDAGNDSIEGDYGADTVIGGAGDDVLTGSAFGDAIFGGDGADFINGGFGFDRVNGGAGGDRFYHTGNAGHGSDWIQDYNAADGDVLMYGSAASAADFLVQRATTPTAGDAGVQELFVTHRASGVLLWALVDGDGQGEINVLAGGQTFDLLV